MNSLDFNSRDINPLRSLYSRLPQDSHDQAVIDPNRSYKVSNVNGVHRVTRCMPKSPLRRASVAIANAISRKRARIAGTRAMLYQKCLQREHANFSDKLAACGPLLAKAKTDLMQGMTDLPTDAANEQRHHLVAQFDKLNRVIFALLEEAKFYASVEQWQTLTALSQATADWMSEQSHPYLDAQKKLDTSLHVAVRNANSNANTIALYSTLRGAGASYTVGNLPGYSRFTSIMYKLLNKENSSEDNASANFDAVIAQAYIEFSALAHGSETALYNAIIRSSNASVRNKCTTSAYIEMIKASIRNRI